MGLVTPRHVGSSWIRSNPCLLHWQPDSLPLSHQGKPIGAFKCGFSPCPHTGTSTPELGSAEARGPVQALGLCRPQWRSKLSALHGLCKHLQLCPLAQLQPELQVFFTLHSQSLPPVSTTLLSPVEPHQRTGRAPRVHSACTGL